jgi:ribosomal protein S18 acetylase RimI-like enzyme
MTAVKVQGGHTGSHDTIRQSGFETVADFPRGRLMPDRFSIVPLPDRRIGEAVRILRDAFEQDPIFCFHIPDAAVRTSVLEVFFEGIIRAHLRFRHIYAAVDGNRIVGVSVWRPPHVTTVTLRDRLRAFMMRRRLMALSPDAARRLLAGFAALEATHPRAPHWYLLFIGLDRALRSRGLGARLMAPVLETADATRSLCYLETPFPQTIAFYKKLGYEVSSEPRPFAGAPQLWAMTRRPSAISAQPQ